MTMLDVLKGRLVDGLTISEAKEKPSKYELTFTMDGMTEKGEIPKSCTPGLQDQVADRTVFNAMAGFALQRGDVANGRFWLNKIHSLGSESAEE